MRLKLFLFFVIVSLSAFGGALGTMIIPSYERMIKGALVVSDGTMIMLGLSSVFTHRNFYGVRLWLLFVFSAVLTIILTSDRFGMVEQLNGMRGLLFFFASLVVVYDLYMSDLRRQFVDLMTKFIIVYAIVQIPFAVYQFLKYGASDAVGGTFGLVGGSGMLSQILYIICFYLLVRYASLDDGSHFKIGKTMLFIPLLIPTMLNETKISFVLLPVFLLLIVAARRKIFRSIAILLMGAVIAFMLNYFYSETVQDTRNLLDQDYFEQYLLHVNPQSGEDLPRLQRLAIMFQMMGKDVGAITLGMGYGVMGGGSVMNVSRLGRRLYYLVTGSRILLFSVWIQGGLLAVLVVGATMFRFAWRRPHYPYVRRRFHLFLLFSLLLVWFYNEAMTERLFALLIWFFVVWLAGQTDEDEHSDVGDEQDDGAAEASPVVPQQ